MKIATGKDLNPFFEQIAPRKLALEGDNVGWQIGNPDRPIDKILVALDVTTAVVDEAIALGANLIYAHHALLYRPMKQIVTSNLQGRIVEKLIESRIGLFVAHTNLDIADEGVNDMLAEALQLEKVKPLDISYVDESSGKQYGIGKIGYLPEVINLEELVQLVKSNYKVKTVRAIGQLDQQIRKVAVVGGSGESYIAKAKFYGADCLISGDISYHYAVDAMQEGFSIIDAGHNIEKIMKKSVAARLQQLIKGKFDIEILESKVNTDPYQYL